jgi:hypothetical protein
VVIGIALFKESIDAFMRMDIRVNAAATCYSAAKSAQTVDEPAPMALPSTKPAALRDIRSRQRIRPSALAGIDPGGSSENPITMTIKGA